MAENEQPESQELPPTHDAVADIPVEFAKGPETTQVLPHIPVTESRGCAHYFVRKSDTEAECRNPGCKLGLFISPSELIIDGQLPDMRQSG